MERRVTYEFTRDELEVIVEGLGLVVNRYRDWVDVYTDQEARELMYQLQEGL